MSLAYSTGASLGPGYHGQAVGYALADASGNSVAAWTSSGVAETLIPGDFTVAGGVSLPDGFTGSILWGLSGQTPAAAEFVSWPVEPDPNPLPASASLGSSWSGLTVGYTLYGLTNTVSAAFTTTGVVAGAVPGDFSVSGGIAVPAGFQGRVVWGTSTSPAAEAWVNTAFPSGVATAGSGPAQLATVYCTDEDVAVRACGNFPQLAPAWQTLAKGTDGAFSTLDPWTLTSVTVDFAACGISAGHVVVLKKTGTFSASGDQFAVAAASGNSLTLRRVGKGAGVGQPPAPAGGLSGVTFSCATMDPQIEDASYEVNQEMGIDPGTLAKTPGDLYDLRQLRQLTVLTVLERVYADNVQGPNTAFALQYKQVCDALDRLRAKAVVGWGAHGLGRNPTTVFSGRTSR